LARTICRRAERKTIALNVDANLIVYLNRLSDFLFTIARKVNADLGEKDVAWEK
jgi:cob(I)alamin adenosyltransferase